MALSLTGEEIRAYERDGLVWPVAVLDGEACARYRRRFEELEAGLGPGRTNVSWMRDLHLHLGWCHDLVLEPRLLDAVEDLIGSDIVVLSSILFVKKPGEGRYVSWHQDSRFYRRDGRPLRALTAWVALAPSTVRNGCLLALPGSHGEGYIPHDDTYESLNMLRRGETARVAVDESSAVAMTLAAGEMSVHHIDTLHASHANEGAEPRIGLAVRYMHPETTLTIDHNPIVLARGAAHGRGDVLARRPPDDLHAGLASLARVVASAPS